MNGKKHFFYLAVILALAVFFRFWEIGSVPPGLWSDEAMNGTNTIQALEGGQWKVYYPENFGREGLFINIQALFVKFFGHEPWVLRTPSAIFGILTVLGLYFLGKELFGRRVGLFASFFLATSFWHIIFSRMGFRAIMAPLFLVWSFYFLLKLLRVAQLEVPTAQNLRDLAQRDGASRAILQQENMRVGANSRAEVQASASKIHYEFLAALAGIMLGLGFHTYIAFRIAPLIALYPLWVFFKSYRSGRLKEEVCAPCFIVLFIVCAIVAASPLLVYYGLHPADFFGRTAGISIFASEEPLGELSENILKTTQMFNFLGDFNWRHNYRGFPQLWWPVGILFLMGIWKSLRKIAGMGEHLAERVRASEARGLAERGLSASETQDVSLGNFPFRFLLLWFLLMMLPVVMSSEGLPHALRAIVLIPPAMIFAALGLEMLIAKVEELIAGWKNKFPEKLFQINRIEAELKILLFIFFIGAAAQTTGQYFFRWAPRIEVYDSFQGDNTKIAHWLNEAPRDVKKYIVSNSVDRADLTGSPLSFQPIVFITDTYFPEKQKEKNIYYAGRAEFEKIDCSSHCVLIPVESNPSIYSELRDRFGVEADPSLGILMFKK